jgi:predicted secreted protein|tara:strand:+ start:52 stop:453 length:402 start_codon:yes stop_codon:yes gene_type:complete
MAKYKGQDGVFQAVTTAGTLATCTNLKSWNIEQSQDSIETSTMGTAGSAKTFVLGQSSWTASCELLYDLDNAVQADLIVGETVDIKIWPNTTSNAESWAGTGIVTASSQSGALGDMVGSSITVQGSGVLTTVA